MPVSRWRKYSRNYAAITDSSLSTNYHLPNVLRQIETRLSTSCKHKLFVPWLFFIVWLKQQCWILIQTMMYFYQP